MVELESVELLALKIMALARAGLLNHFDCLECEKEDQEERNCKCVDQVDEVYTNELTGSLTACPLKYVPATIRDFLEEYMYYEKYPGAAPKFGDCNPRYWEAVKKYEQYQIEAIEQKKGNKIDNNDSARQKIRDRFKRK